MDNVHIDKEYLYNQLYENNRTEKGYLELKAIVPSLENEKDLRKSMPIIKMDSNNAGALEIGLLIVSLEEAIRRYKKMPQVKDAYRYCNKKIKKLSSSMVRIDKDDKK